METPPEIRYLIAAVFLSEDLSFTRAAKRLKLSQSGLSRRLNELERRCGVKLFTRDPAKVAITDAGRAFVEEAKLSIHHCESAMQSAKRAHAGAVSHLTIGHSPYIDPLLIATLFSIRLPLHPNLLLSMQSDFAPELVHGLATSKLDLALIAHPGANRKLTMTKIAEAPFYIAIPDDHPLAARETLRLEDMHGCTWIIFDRKVHPILHDMISRRAAEEGVIYRNNQNVLTAEEAFQLVSENVGIAFLTMASALRTKSHNLDKVIGAKPDVTGEVLDAAYASLVTGLQIAEDQSAKSVASIVRLNHVLGYAQDTVKISAVFGNLYQLQQKR